jgi:hypothetical protein
MHAYVQCLTNHKRYQLCLELQEIIAYVFETAHSSLPLLSKPRIKMDELESWSLIKSAKKEYNFDRKIDATQRMHLDEEKLIASGSVLFDEKGRYLTSSAAGRKARVGFRCQIVVDETGTILDAARAVRPENHERGSVHVHGSSRDLFGNYVTNQQKLACCLLLIQMASA